MDKLKILEKEFYEYNPMGFESPEMKIIEKKHKLEKFYSQAHEYFSIEGFKEKEVLDRFQKIINASTLVSRFEKPAFKDFMAIISDGERAFLKTGLYEFIHGDEALGFNMMVELLTQHKVAKWPILTVVKTYYNPQEDVFVKPTTVKKILKYFNVTDFSYSPKPSYEFYNTYRTFFNQLKAQATDGVKPNNATFSGFLMMMIEG